MSTEVALLVVLVAGAALVALAPALRVPYPIVLLFGGVALGFVPGVPEVEISPDLVLLILLPPLLYSAAFFAPLGSLRRNARPIGGLAVIVVALTCAGVAVAAHLVLGIPWAVAFVLGAVVGPTDPTAIEAIAKRLRAPRELVSIVQGESLINDATALTLLASTLAVAVAGELSWGETALRFAWGVIGGVLVGLAVGWVAIQARKRLDSPPEELAISLASAYVAYLVADVGESSGVIAAVVIGALHGRRQGDWVSPATRLQTFAFWRLLSFLINAGLFALVGLQLPSVLEGLDTPALTVLGGIALLTVVVFGVRGLWIVSATSVLRVIEQRGRPVGALPNAYVTIVAACGMRGGVSLAAALSIPAIIDGGGSFPDRDLVLTLTFGTIVTTLVGGGLALPLLLRRFGLVGDEDAEREEVHARSAAAHAALERLDELRDEDWVRDDSADRLAGLYRFRIERFENRAEHGLEHEAEERSQSYQRLRRELLGAERAALRRLRDADEIDGDVAGRVEYDLDLEDTRLDA